MYKSNNTEVAHSRTRGIFIPDTVYFHCDSIKHKVILPLSFESACCATIAVLKIIKCAVQECGYAFNIKLYITLPHLGVLKIALHKTILDV